MVFVPILANYLAAIAKHDVQVLFSTLYAMRNNNVRGITLMVTAPTVSDLNRCVLVTILYLLPAGIARSNPPRNSNRYKLRAVLALRPNSPELVPGSAAVTTGAEVGNDCVAKILPESQRIHPFNSRNRWQKLKFNKLPKQSRFSGLNLKRPMSSYATALAIKMAQSAGKADVALEDMGLLRLEFKFFQLKKRQARVGVTWRFFTLQPTQISGISVTHLTNN